MGKSVKKLLITGGAGFIGTNIIRSLLDSEVEITVVDNFHKQIHGEVNELPSDISKHVRLIVGDISDKEVLHKALEGQDSIIHLAAETGTGQSMYEIDRYSKVNIQATASLCDYLINSQNNIQNLLVASSRSIYGEGKYHSIDYGIVYPNSRSFASIKNGFDVTCPLSGDRNLKLLPTDEESKLHPSSFYGITKQVQEQMILMTGKLLKISTYALRYQNVYGPGQSLKNPYTGILSVFSRLALYNEPLNVFEDGCESRDFVYIDDVVDATLKCLFKESTEQHALNVGSGIATDILTIAHEIKKYLKSESKIKITGAYREGDIRHNYADLSKVKTILDFEPRWNFTDGLHQFLDWVLSQKDMPKTTRDYNKSLLELKKKGLYNE